MIRNFRKRFGRGIQAILIKWTSKLYSSSSATSSSPHPFIQLPNELIQCILDHLYYDTPTLLNCALVARAWAVPAQRGIFQEIVLEFPHVGVYESSRSMRTRHTLLTRSFRKINATLANSRLASYVQSLKLYNFVDYSGGKVVGSLHAAAAQIVQCLSKVNKVQLSAPSLTQIYLSNFFVSTFAELASLLGHATHLKVLHVKETMLRYLGKNLRELELLEEYDGFPYHITDFLDHTPNLHSLTLHTRITKSIRHIEALFKPLPNLDGTSFSLRYLTLNFMFYSAFSATSVDHQNLCDQWVVLDTILERPEFSLLEMVHIRLIEAEHYFTIPDGYREFYRRTFSSLEGSGKLTVSRLKIADTIEIPF
ncbi:hypothetical protein BT96DRAFT_1026527 [Gymnopus androsaceus JB14]|uniref:F-box domain-containing protein n=1 Tax=Gymnopus androsaceus JB14 TaxID=1447944 RepID=A0A6A4GJT8_9AGAR|nr:hypothetical protein BT96DRAFT_1026527 [Gymnopus androsaceus JB14]